MKCAYLVLILLLVLAICANAARKGRPKPSGRKTKKGKKKPRPPRPALPPKPTPPLEPALKCSPDQTEMNRWLQKTLEKAIQDDKKSYRAMYFCGLWKVVELAQDYKRVLRGVEFIDHKFITTKPKREYVSEFEKKHSKKIVKYFQPLTIGNITLLPFGCKWEIYRKDKGVSCLFVTSAFPNFLKELAIPNNPSLKDIHIWLYFLQDM